MHQVADLQLHFSSVENPELMRTVFYSTEHQERIVGVRGTMSSHCSMSFKWTTTTHAVSIFFAKVALLGQVRESRLEIDPILSGHSQTPAAVIGKLWNRSKDTWLLDLFGADRNGRSALLKSMGCLNYRRRFPGPVEVYANTKYLPPSSIHVIVNGTDISGNIDRLADLSSRLESNWKPGNSGLSAATQKESQSPTSVNFSEDAT